MPEPETESEPEVNIHPEPEVNPLPATMPKVPRKKVSARIYSFKEAKVNTHFATAGKGWKRSAKRSGWLIERIPGYDIVEDEYGVSYVFVLTRTPKKKTSSDYTKHEHAGFFTWTALELAGRLRKETGHARRTVN